MQRRSNGTERGSGIGTPGEATERKLPIPGYTRNAGNVVRVYLGILSRGAGGGEDKYTRL